MRSSFDRCVAALVLALAAASAGCSGSDSDGSPSAAADSEADAALAEPTCYLGLKIPGVSYSGIACSGTTTRSSVTGVSNSTPVISVAVLLDAPPAVGPLSVSSMTVDLPTDGTSHLWIAPSSCTLEATGTAVEEFFGWDYYRIDVSCSEPAVPDSGNSGEPLELGDFSIVTFFDRTL